MRLLREYVDEYVNGDQFGFQPTLRCNLVCRHCAARSSPDRSETCDIAEVTDWFSQIGTLRPGATIYGAYSCKKRKFLREARVALTGEDDSAQGEEEVQADTPHARSGSAAGGGPGRRPSSG